ncbi:hypothetical protein [Henriciella pelagia]|uniref:hypothetical protein n=1 Tax=Henriciella pelagia TaxID=1977912 RepID=UPI0035151C2B
MADDEKQPDIGQLFEQLQTAIRAAQKASTAVVQEDLERLALQLGDRMNAKVSLVMQRLDSLEQRLDDHIRASEQRMEKEFENIGLKLERERGTAINNELDRKLPVALAVLMEERRRGFWAFCKRHMSWVASLFMLLAARVTFWMATKGQDPSAAEKVAKGLTPFSR